MTIDFIHMDGNRFEDMCESVCHAEFGAVPIEANPGDGGIDSFRGSLTDGVDHIWQYKHFPDGIGEAQKAQIRASLKTAVKNYKPKKWTLVVPCNLDEGAQKWFEKQRTEFAKQGVEVDYIGGTGLRNLLIKHQGIRQEYFPNTDDQLKAVTALMGGRDAVFEKPKASAVELNQTLVDYINADNPDWGFRLHTDEHGQTVETFLRNPDAADKTAAKITLKFGEDPIGKKVHKAWVDLHKKGTPFVVEGTHFDINQSVFDALLPKEGFTSSKLVIKPLVPKRRLPMSMTFTSKNGESVTLPFIDLHLDREGSEEMHFSNEAQDHILRIGLTASAKNGGMTVKTRNYVGRKPSDVVLCEEALTIASQEGSRMDMTHLEMNLTVGSAIKSADFDKVMEHELTQFYRDLAVIERRLDPSLRIPESYYDRDVRAARMLASILEGDEATAEGTVNAEMTVEDPDGARAMLAKGESVTYVTEDVQRVPLFDKSYEFDMTRTLTAPLVLVDVDAAALVKGSVVRVRQEGDAVTRYENGRIGTAEPESDE